MGGGSLWCRLCLGYSVRRLVRCRFLPGRAFPMEQWIVELVVCHALFKQACHFAFAGHTKVYAFSVIDACVFHVGDEAWAFPCEVHADSLEPAPAVLQGFDVAQDGGVDGGLLERF